MISIRKVITEKDWQDLAEFGASFDHEARDRTLPVVIFERAGKIRGYAQIHKNTPLAITGWHTDPEICSPMDVVHGMMYLKGWAKVEMGGGLTAVQMGSKSFTPEVMEKLGFKRTGFELYQTA